MAATIEQVNMTEGALLPKIIRFSLPLAATGVLQLLFNAADVIVVGKFAGATALAAVGATTALINLLVNAFMGISVGVNILVARYLGCREDERVRACVHTAFALSLLLGLVVMAAGLTLSTPMLELMKRPRTCYRCRVSIFASIFSAFPAPSCITSAPHFCVRSETRSAPWSF